MKSSLVFAALAGVISVDAATCQYIKDIKPNPDPFAQNHPGNATFPCDMGSAIPLGKVPTGCAKFEIIVARGTSEPGDLGVIVGDPLVARVKRNMPGIEVRGYPVQYPANMLGGSTGVADIQKRLSGQIKACPDEKFALVGYSQGGMITTQVTPKLSKDVLEKVLAVVLYGAQDGSNMGALKTKTLANCAPGDFACGDRSSGPGHVSYNDVGTIWHDRAAKYIASAFEGKPMGQKLAKSPTAPSL